MTQTEPQETFTFETEPIRGYPELKWAGKRPFTGVPYYPAQLKESYNNTPPRVSNEIDDNYDGWRNRIYWGDNLQVMSHLLREFRGKVDLIYIDPPFDSKADYKKKIGLRGKSAASDTSAFEEKQYGDIWTNDEYLQFMYERLILCRELLADTGSIYVHCDWHRNSYIRIVLDELFGNENFKNEICWCYTGPAQASKNFPRKHDTILFYSKSNKSIFNPQFISHKSGVHNSGKLFGSDTEENDELKAELEAQGKKLEDWWVDIWSCDRYRAEMLNYPTQKPEALLERIIKASSNPGDLVFDCFMGSGTTQAVAMKLGRRFLGADINLGAIQTTTKRLLNVAKELKEKIVGSSPTMTSSQQSLFKENVSNPCDNYYLDFDVYNVNDYDFFRNELEAKRLICDALGFTELPENSLWDALDEENGRKVCILGINRIATASEFAKITSNIDVREWQRNQQENPASPVEKITFVCMGHDPNLKAQFENEIDKMGFKVDLEIIDLLRDKKDLRFKRASDAELAIENGFLVIKNFFPMNLLQKLSIEKTDVSNWKELCDSVMIDWNYDGATFSPAVTDIPDKKELVKGIYKIPASAGTIHVKITDLISESWEGSING